MKYFVVVTEDYTEEEVDRHGPIADLRAAQRKADEVFDYYSVANRAVAIAVVDEDGNEVDEP